MLPTLVPSKAGRLASSFKSCYRAAVNPGRLKAGRAVAETSRDDALSLTGLWNGLFSYPRRYDPTPFVAILIQSGTSFSGTTHEPCAIKQIPGGHGSCVVPLKL